MGKSQEITFRISYKILFGLLSYTQCNVNNENVTSYFSVETFFPTQVEEEVEDDHDREEDDDEDDEDQDEEEGEPGGLAPSADMLEPRTPHLSPSMQVNHK